MKEFDEVVVLVYNFTKDLRKTDLYKKSKDVEQDEIEKRVTSVLSVLGQIHACNSINRLITTKEGE